MLSLTTDATDHAWAEEGCPPRHGRRANELRSARTPGRRPNRPSGRGHAAPGQPLIDRSPTFTATATDRSASDGAQDGWADGHAGGAPAVGERTCVEGVGADGPEADGPDHPAIPRGNRLANPPQIRPEKPDRPARRLGRPEAADPPLGPRRLEQQARPGPLARPRTVGRRRDRGSRPRASAPGPARSPAPVGGARDGARPAQVNGPARPPRPGPSSTKVAARRAG